MTLSIEQCQTIYDQASLMPYAEYSGDVKAFKQYLDNGNTEGFERVCRGCYMMLCDNNIQYSPTDGISERWYSDGILAERSTYKDGLLHGLYECWQVGGMLLYRVIFTHGKITNGWAGPVGTAPQL